MKEHSLGRTVIVDSVITLSDVPVQTGVFRKCTITVKCTTCTIMGHARNNSGIL